ncbi:hypothetical protein AgCh_024378 [Apium graveolens]
MATKNSTTSFDDLPQEMAANILTRLPVKALIRSTSVNKKCTNSNDYRVVRVVIDVVHMKSPKVEFLLVGNEKALKYRDGDSKDLWMLSFDFDSEVFGEVKFPKKVSNCLGVDAKFKLKEFEHSLALCVSDVQWSNGVAVNPYHMWLMRQENGVLSWNLRFRVELEGGFARNITKAETILLEKYPSRDCLGVSGIFSCNLKTMHYKDLGYGRRRDAEDFSLLHELCNVDASFMESLVMYEGGKSPLKFTK